MLLHILAFAAGILFLQTRPELITWEMPASVGFLLCGLRLRRSHRAWPALTMLACLLLGIAWAGWRAEIRLADRLGADWEGRDVEVLGIVAGLPQNFGNGSRFEFDVTDSLTPGAVVPQRIMLSSYRSRRKPAQFEPQSVRPGEMWRLTVRLKRPHGNANPGGFDYEAWLLERNIRATGYLRPNPPQRLVEMVWRPDYAIERLRYAIRGTFERLLPADAYPWAGVLVALTIGDQKAIDGKQWTTFNRTGTTHLMSISGLHVTMVAALFGWLATFIWRRVPILALRLPAQKAGLLAACLGAFGYALLAGFAIPAQRTLYMLLVAALAMLSGRIVAPSRILALALLVVLLVDPWAVLAAGFWLSFGAVGVLLYIGAAAVGEGRGWSNRIRAWGAVQWAATLASLPILLIVFQQFSLVSPLANALAIPVISFVVTPLALLGTILPWWPILALAHQVLAWLMIFLAWCASWPVWLAPAPPLWAALVAGAGVFVCLLPRALPGRWLGGVLLFPILFWPTAKPPTGEVWIDILDVGQGLASLVRTREHTLIYDPGPRYGADSDAGQRVVVPYMRSLGIAHADMLMVTHRDADHAGGTASVMAALSIDEIRSSVDWLDGHRCAAGQRWQWDGVMFKVLHPAPEAYATEKRPNRLSCVLRIEAGGQRLLLTSDIEAPNEAALLRRYPDGLRADILLVPHHGSKTSSTPAFLHAVGASQVVIPVGYRNRFGHPKATILARYEAMAAKVWRTDRDGAVRIVLGGPAVAISGYRHEARRYWFER